MPKVTSSLSFHSVEAHRQAAGPLEPARLRSQQVFARRNASWLVVAQQRCAVINLPRADTRSVTSFFPRLKPSTRSRTLPPLSHDACLQKEPVVLAARLAIRTAPGDEDKTVSHGDEDGPEHATLCVCNPVFLLRGGALCCSLIFVEVLDVYIPELPTEHKGRRFGFVTFALVAAAAHARSNAQHRAFSGAFLNVLWGTGPIRRRPPNGFARSRAQYGIAGSKAKNKNGVASALFSENTNNDKWSYPILNSPVSLPAAMPRCVQRRCT